MYDQVVESCDCVAL